MSALDHLVRRALRRLDAYAPPPRHGTETRAKLDANELPFALPPEAKALLSARLAAVALHRYPDARAEALRAALADRVGGDPADLVVGVGSDEVIALLLAALGEPREGRDRPSVLYPVPTFSMYGVSARVHGYETIEVPLDAHFDLDVEACAGALGRARPNLVFLATPNNPTANAFAEANVRALALADPGALVVVDEAYAAFAERSLAHLCDDLPNVALLGTLSKVGFAAARVGYCRLPPGLAASVDKARQPYNLSALSQEVALLALTDLAPAIDALVARVVAERARLSAALRASGRFHVYPSAANFLWTRYEAELGPLTSALAAAGVRVKSFDAAGGRLAGHLRITVGAPAENDALLAALP